MNDKLKLQSDIDVDGVTIENLELKVNRDFDASKGPLNFNIELSQKIGLSEDETHGFSRLTAFISSQDKENSPYSLTLTVQGEFSLKDEERIDEFKHYLAKESASILLPYIREIVGSLTARTVFPALTIPFYEPHMRASTLAEEGPVKQS